MNRTIDLTHGEHGLLRTVAEPFVFMPDGLLEPLSSGRVAELWWRETAKAIVRESESA